MRISRSVWQWKQRLVKNARIQEGDTPEEDPAELQAELEKLARELTVLIQRINRTMRRRRSAAERLRSGTF